MHSAPGSRSGLRSTSSAGLRSQPLQSRPSRLRLGLDGRLAALAAINKVLAALGRETLGRHVRVIRAACLRSPSAARSTPPVSIAYIVLRSRALRLRLALRRCPPLALTSLRSRVLRLRLAVCHRHPPVSRSLLQNARVRILAARSNDAARSSTTPVSTAYFVSRSRALRLRLAHASVHRSAIRVGGVHRYAWHCTE